ncbi:MAG TPA: hypothetical protein VJ023_21325 [Pyrinomonadaceae bacterium]|nr:hypothetical protein [Pyrinomonadaceae bacterium]
MKNETASKSGEKRFSSGEMSESEIDYNVMGSFPASDPPSWTMGVGPHRKAHDNLEGEKPSATEPSHQNEPTQ